MVDCSGELSEAVNRAAVSSSMFGLWKQDAIFELEG